MADELSDELHRQVPYVFGNSGSESDHVKEVYARFGLTYYHAEVLHRGLCNLYSLSQIPSGGPITRPRIEEHLRTAFESTFGQLLERLGPILPAPLIPRLRAGLERRNFLAHHFWFERIHLMISVSGIETMLNELASDTELFRELDEEIEKLVEPLYPRIGLTPELYAQAVNDVATGMHCEPLSQQRKSYKQETIIKVFDVPTSSGNSILVFQSADGVLWQLCDVGLGWTHYDRAEPAWPVATKFDKLLPARINPRPKIRASWNFDIPFSSQVTLSVRPGKRSGEVIYGLRAQTAASR